MVEISELPEKSKKTIQRRKIISAILCIIFLILFILLLILKNDNLIIASSIVGFIATIYSIWVISLIIAIKSTKKTN